MNSKLDASPGEAFIECGESPEPWPIVRCTKVRLLIDILLQRWHCAHGLLRVEAMICGQRSNDAN
jgi:hypothetical protein